METLPRIVIIDDDKDICDSVVTFFQARNFIINSFTDSPTGLNFIAHNAVDLVILDMMMPTIDGIECCRRLRQYSQVPILMLTAITDDVEHAVALAQGVDEYLTKPFNLRILLAHIKAMLRRQTLPPTQQQEKKTKSVVVEHDIYEFSGWQLNVSKRCLLSPHKVEVILSAAEYNLLVFLVEHPNHVLTRDFLLNATSNEADNFDRSIDTLVSRIRRKMEAQMPEPRIIKTVRNGGYIFESSITQSKLSVS